MSLSGCSSMMTRVVRRCRSSVSNGVALAAVAMRPSSSVFGSSSSFALSSSSSSSSSSFSSFSFSSTSSLVAMPRPSSSLPPLPHRFATDAAAAADGAGDADADANANANADASSSKPPPTPLQRAMRTCIDQVKASDVETFAALTLLPPHVKSAVFAVRALNCELEAAMDSASDISVAQLKCAWWSQSIESMYAQPSVVARDVIQQERVGGRCNSSADAACSGTATTAASNAASDDAVADDAAAVDAGLQQFHINGEAVDAGLVSGRGHPVVDVLSRAIVPVFDVSRSWFRRLIAARVRECETGGVVVDMPALTRHCADTECAMLYLTLETMGVRDADADHVASHVGTALGLVSLLKRLPYTAATQGVPANTVGGGGNFKQRDAVCGLPQSVVAATKLDPASLYAGQPTRALQEAVFQIACVARDHLHHARSETLMSKLAPHVRVAFLPAIVADDYLELLQDCNFNVFDERMRTMSSKQLLVQRMRLHEAFQAGTF